MGRDEEDGVVADGGEALARALAGMLALEERGIGGCEQPGHPLVLRGELGQQLLLRGEVRRVAARDAAALEGVAPGGRERRLQAEHLRQLIRRGRQMAQKPGRMVDEAVRLPGHLLVREVADERAGSFQVEPVGEYQVPQHRFAPRVPSVPKRLAGWPFRPIPPLHDSAPRNFAFAALCGAES